jgi:hypothetical protein
VHNPGTIPDDPRLFAGADVICIFENPYANYAGTWKAGIQNLVANPINGYGRRDFANMVSGVPTNWTAGDMDSFVDEIRPYAQYLFVTDINIEQQDIYASFGSSWDEFVEKVSLTPATNYNF